MATQVSIYLYGDHHNSFQPPSLQYCLLWRTQWVCCMWDWQCCCSTSSPYPSATTTVCSSNPITCGELDTALSFLSLSLFLHLSFISTQTAIFMNLKTTGGGDSDYMMCDLKSPKLHKSSWIKLSDGLDRGGVILPHDHGSGVEWQLRLELLFLLVSILRRSVCWRQGQNLQGIEGILLSSNILLCIPDPSTIAVGVAMGGVRNTPITIHNFQ